MKMNTRTNKNMKRRKKIQNKGSMNMKTNNINIKQSMKPKIERGMDMNNSKKMM